MCKLCVLLSLSGEHLGQPLTTETVRTQRPHRAKLSPVDLTQNNVERTDYRYHISDQMADTELLQRLQVY